MPTREAFRYSVKTYPIGDSPLIGAAQFRTVTEIAPKSPLLCVNWNPIQYGFRAWRKSYPVQCERDLKLPDDFDAD